MSDNIDYVKSVDYSTFAVDMVGAGVSVSLNNYLALSEIYVLILILTGEIFGSIIPARSNKLFII